MILVLPLQSMQPKEFGERSAANSFNGAGHNDGGNGVVENNGGVATMESPQAMVESTSPAAVELQTSTASNHPSVNDPSFFRGSMSQQTHSWRA